MKKKRILVAALNWGLGHASRCVPIIRELEKQQFQPIMASDGAALELLKKEFPHLQAVTLPSYAIEYAVQPNLLKWKLFLESPRIWKIIKAEKAMTNQLVEQYNLNGIISDNRFGVRYKHLKNVFLTHQLNVLSGNTSWLSSKLHQKYIRKFDECWVPDAPGVKNLSGILGHLKNTPDYVKYTGLLSRFTKKPASLKYEVCVLLSGPEPQRTILEDILLREFQATNNSTLFVRGIMEDSDLPSCDNPALEIRNYLYGIALEEALNASRLVLARSGYSSIMDLATLQKKAFFIPTPGQFEQEYLAKRLMELGIAPRCTQEEFSIKKLTKVKHYSGFTRLYSGEPLRSLFALFQGK